MSIIKTHTKFLGCLLVLTASNASFGQENTVHINGRVRSLNNDVSNILVVNLNSKKSTITDTLGLFTIEAKLRDSIRFSSVQYLTKEIVITDTIFLKNSVAVNLVENIINLNEVIVTPYNLTGKIKKDIKRLNIESDVTSSTLGLPNADLEVMTQSERLLLVADRGKYARFMTIEEKMKEKNILGFLTIGVMLNPDKIFSRVSGKTKSLEDMVARDENVKMENKIISMFSKKTISEAFGISQNNVDGFLSFCLAQPDFFQIGRS
jgi:hypothetical protein